jgi:hypothetical protein
MSRILLLCLLASGASRRKIREFSSAFARSIGANVANFPSLLPFLLSSRCFQVGERNFPNFDVFYAAPPRRPGSASLVTVGRECGFGKGREKSTGNPLEFRAHRY